MAASSHQCSRPDRHVIIHVEFLGDAAILGGGNRYSVSDNSPKDSLHAGVRETECAEARLVFNSLQ